MRAVLNSVLSLLPFTSPYWVVAILLWGVSQGGVYTLSAAAFVLVLHPFLDHLLSQRKPVDSKVSHTLASALLWGYVPVQTMMIVWVLGRGFDPTSAEFWGAAFSLGVATGGLGITIAHELIHRRVKWERALGVLLLLEVNYSHFRIEHVLGHHRWVGTPHDPATARKGESLFQFLPRTLIGSFRSAIRLNSRFVLLGVFAQGFVLLGLAWGMGFASVLLYLIQSGVAVLMLETINYIEHYGLQRKELRPGVYEAVTDEHSWNSLHRLTNWFLFNLGMHAEHHAHPLVPFQKLQAIPRPRTLPYGYSLLLWMAWFPPLFRRALDSRLP